MSVEISVARPPRSATALCQYVVSINSSPFEHSIFPKAKSNLGLDIGTAFLDQAFYPCTAINIAVLPFTPNSLIKAPSLSKRCTSATSPRDVAVTRADI
jgi:hypothetical protein